MTAGMRLQIGELRESLLTSRMSTFIGFVAGMSAYMLLKMRKLRELPLTDLTAVRLNAKMNAGVL